MNKENNLGNLINIKVKLNGQINDTCTIGLVSLDDKILEKSEKLLLTIVGKMRNTNQIWDEGKTTTKKAGWGTAPTLVQFIEMEAKLKFKEEEKPQVFSINRYGELGKEFKLSGEKNNWVLKSDEENPTLNYYIIRKLPIEKNGSKTLVVIIVSVSLIVIIAIVIIFLFKRKNILKNKEVEKLLNDKEDKILNINV